MVEENAQRLVVETSADPGEIQFLEDRIYEFNVEATGIADGEVVAVFLRGPDGSVTGGAYGWTWGDTCYIRSLYLPQNMRNAGHGTRIMRAVEQEARARGCQQMVVETHDFQAPGFYERLGFTTVGVVDDYPRGHQYITLLKRLSEP